MLQLNCFPDRDFAQHCATLLANPIIHTLPILNKVKSVLYIGNSGSLLAKYAPNESLATGDGSYIEHRMVECDKVLELYLEQLSLAVRAFMYQYLHPYSKHNLGWENGSLNILG
jgi:hypothetical protein